MASKHDVAPGVSYVMPVLNERAYVEDAVRTVLTQEYAGEQDLVLALGPSTDGTTELVEKLSKEDPRVSFVHNPGTDIPVGLNLAIASTAHPIIVRVDAHSELAPGYTTRAVETLARTGAANVGGVMVANGKTPFQTAVARAYNSKFGLGGASYHSGGKEGPAESAYLGVFQRDILAEVGGYDESLRRGEDWELNLRIREAGHKVWFDPELKVTYWPRENWRKLTRQFFTTGVWRGELVRRHPRHTPLRFFAPPLLVLAFLASIIGGSLQIAGVIHWGKLSYLVFAVHIGLVAYILLLIYLGLIYENGKSWRDRWLFILVLPSMHLSWGAGFLRGLFVGGRNTMDTSRTDL
ncbi:MAG TPA: glycosyltransferase family 2 protein [Galbitalea sp.]|nr:glycosyltransferase family 2 protein [Galbitalea sp.]